MIEPLASALEAAVATNGLWLLVVAAIASGLVRGFSGFGTAMVYMPVAGTVLPPVWAIITILVFALIGPLPIVPKALREGTPRDVLRLGSGALIGLPLGLFLLYRIEPDVFRWGVSGIALVLLVLLISGWRYGGEMTRPLVYVTGALGGFLGGVSGLPGPPVIMLYMSSRKAISAMRANILLYLIYVDVLTLGVMGLSGRLELVPVMIGIVLIPPFLIANLIGAALFRPEREKTYRVFAYFLIGASALSNLPVFG